LSGVRSGLYLLRDSLTSPVEVLERLNRLVRETAPRRMFVTLQIAILQADSGRLTVSNAGHPPLIRIDAATGKAEVLGTSGLPLGTHLNPEFSIAEAALEPGDVLVFYTDGVLEVTNLHEESFGEARLRREVERTGRRSSAREIRDSLLNEVSRFKGDVTQTDDLTLVVARFAP
jgi:sigma-B regulation protein RsbU (phosphoserine phosphatase)